MRKNKYCPVWIKLKVLNTCVNSSLTYGCETWANHSIEPIEKLHRKGLKIALGVRDNTPSDILYTETGHLPLMPYVKSRQLKFWSDLCRDRTDHPGSPLSRLILSAINQNLPFIRYYITLQENYLSPSQASSSLRDNIRRRIHDSLQSQMSTDPHGKLGTYCHINPTLEVNPM